MNLSLTKLQQDYKNVVLSGENRSPDWILDKAPLSKSERLGIYQFSYEARLIECLKDDFNCLDQVLGSERFNALAKTYLAKHPSKSFTAVDLGLSFCDFLKNESSLSQESVLIELARLEWALNESFYAVERERLGLEKRNHATPEQWAEAVLILSPSVHLFSFQYPVHQILENPDKPLLTCEPTWILVSLWKDNSVYEQISQNEFQFLQAVQAGTPLGQIGESFPAMDLSPETFFRWLDEGVLHSIDWISWK